MIKRIAIAAAAGATVFTVALASASALDVDPGVAQTSGKVDLRGDADGVTVASYRFEEDTLSSAGVRLTGVDPSLAGGQIFASVYNADGARIAEGDTIIPEDTSGRGFTVNWEGDKPSIKDIEQVQLTIESD